MIMKKLTPTKDAYKLFHDGTVALSQVEANGIRVDLKYLDKAIDDTKQKIKEGIAALKADPVFSQWKRRFGEQTKLGSKDQLAILMFDVLGHTRNTEVTEAGNPTQDEKAFADIDLPFIKTYFQTEKLKKSLGTYLNGIRNEVVGDRVHPSFNLYKIITYRSSSSKPNFQNIPIRNPVMAEIIRRCYIPSEGNYIGEIDFSGIEVRVSACYNKDPVLIKYITDPTTDMHRDMACQIFMLKPEQVDKKGPRDCNTPEAPIWMADFTFKPLGEVKVGDKVIGWHRPDGGVPSEGKRGNKQNRKRLVRSTVTDINRRIAPIVKVTMESGRVIRCTADHWWLNGKMQLRGHDVFINPEVGKYLGHVIDPTPELPDSLVRTAAWLGGIFDGEGHAGKHRGLCVAAQSETHNPTVCRAIEESLDRLGFKYSIQSYTSKSNGRILGKTNSYCLVTRSGTKAGMQNEVDFLNWCQPARRKKIINSLKTRSSFLHPDKIVKVEPDGKGEVICMTTTSGNYIAWGYASKNCAKNMFVFPSFYGSVWFQTAADMWKAMQTRKFKIKDTEDLVADHLTKKGIKELGDCTPGGSPKKGTFAEHVQQVEKDFWENRFRVYSQWKRSWYNGYLQRGGFRFYTGFVCQGIFARNDVLNYAIQGSAFHCLLWSLVKIQKWLRKNKMKTKIVGEIHDSLVADIYPPELDIFLAKCKQVMTVDLPEHWKWINVPIDVEAELAPRGANWFEKKGHPFPQ